MNKLGKKFWWTSIAAGVLLGGSTLAASIWGSLTVLSFAQEKFTWPAEQVPRLLTYCLVGWISLLPAIIAVCIPLGLVWRQSAPLGGLVAAVTTVLIWLAVYDWSDKLPSVLYYSEVLGILVLSTLLAALGGVLGRYFHKENSSPGGSSSA